MNYTENDYLQLSGLQHYLYCSRQWALIHLEQQWVDNIHTVIGDIMHQRTHDEFITEKRGNLLITRGMQIASPTLQLSGQCDVLEFYQEDQENQKALGVQLFGWEGNWIPFPVEYKKGEPKEGNYDRAQLCAQAMCLEEMLCCRIEKGALFYGTTKRRTPVTFAEDLRETVTSACTEMHKLYRRGHTPQKKKTKQCNACSLKELCLPQKSTMKKVAKYYEEHL